ncbi:hypothetical protein [Jeotgalibaca caeni]|uniref:hypothetical protein n=1 Tax=Jeotgalibaca caeni TaxID=3028623 RepID=UPI00237D5208|nr:hypothetical protein [Jeotgalibaca caeni]MDE1548528.1 hypothetical protein [Jeotgalibaca caeni]
MDYEKFVTYLENNNLESDHQELYNFSQLKLARYELSNLLSKNEFKKDTEEKLKRILSHLNKIHANQTHLEKIVQAVYQDE